LGIGGTIVLGETIIGDKMSLSAKRLKEKMARQVAFATGSHNLIMVNPTPPTKAEIESWAAENGVTVTVLTSPTGKIEAVQTDNDFDNDRIMGWIESRM
jgi:hypothetical protein